MPSTTRRDFVRTAAIVPIALSQLARTALAAESGATQTDRSAHKAAPERFDYVIAGAGHNSLVCAAYLAKAGFRVLVLEGRSMIGGGCKTAEILMPGFKEDLCSSSHAAFAANTIFKNDELQLAQYGYELLYPDVVLHYPFMDGASITLYHNDVERTAATIAAFSKKDADTFRRVHAGRKLASAQLSQGAEQRANAYFQSLAKLSGYAACRMLWESPYTRAASLSGGRFFGPLGSDLGTGRHAFSLSDFMQGRPIPKGGSGMLTVALGRVITAHDGLLLTNKPVVRLLIEGGKCRGVECKDGTQYHAEKGVVSTIHIKHLMEMAPKELWGDALTDDANLMQPEMAMFQFHYAMSEAPRYKLADGSTVSSCEASIMDSPESIFRLNSDQATGELNIDDYPLQIVHPAVFDATRVPNGCGLLKIEGCLTYDLKEGPAHWDVIKEQIAEKISDRYFKYTANLSREKILVKFLLSPIDIERMDPAMWRGSVHHFDNRLSNFAPYRMPIAGLYQTGSCTAPGGSISGMPGRNAAEIILQDEGKTIQQAIANRRSA